MALHSKRLKLVFAGFIALAMTIGFQSALAQDVAHAVSGVVKHVDKGTKTFVVKADDGTEHTIKWTANTTVKAAKDTGKGVAAGSEDAAKGTEKASVDSYLDAKQGSRASRFDGCMQFLDQPIDVLAPPVVKRHTAAVSGKGRTVRK